jgi:hypothetical protein
MAVTLILNPRTDEEFVAFAERTLAEGVSSAEEFERVLRTRFPQAVVRPRGLANELQEVWYCYRDGRWTRSRGSS